MENNPKAVLDSINEFLRKEQETAQQKYSTLKYKIKVFHYEDLNAFCIYGPLKIISDFKAILRFKILGFFICSKTHGSLNWNIKQLNS